MTRQGNITIRNQPYAEDYLPIGRSAVHVIPVKIIVGHILGISIKTKEVLGPRD